MYVALIEIPSNNLAYSRVNAHLKFLSVLSIRVISGEDLSSRCHRGPFSFYAAVCISAFRKAKECQECAKLVRPHQDQGSFSKKQDGFAHTLVSWDWDFRVAQYLEFNLPAPPSPIFKMGFWLRINSLDNHIFYHARHHKKQTHSIVIPFLKV